jgi:hypothetical protein
VPSDELEKRTKVDDVYIERNVWTTIHTNAYVLRVHTYHSRFFLEGEAEVSQILLQDTHVLPRLQCSS